MAVLSPAFRRALRPSSLLVYLALAIICACCLVPVIWTISSSLKTREELYMVTPSLIPRHPTLMNYTWIAPPGS